MQKSSIDYDKFIEGIKNIEGYPQESPEIIRVAAMKKIRDWGNCGLCPKAITKSSRGGGKSSYFPWDAAYQFRASYRLWKNSEWNFSRKEIAKARYDALELWDKRDLTERERIIKDLWKKYYEQEISGR